MFVSYCFHILLGFINAMDCFIRFYIVYAIKFLYQFFFGKPKFDGHFNIPNHLAVLFVDKKLINFVRINFFFFIFKFFRILLVTLFHIR